MFLQSDNSSMWESGQWMGYLFFAVIILLGIFVWWLVARGSGGTSNDTEE